METTPNRSRKWIFVRWLLLLLAFITSIIIQNLYLAIQRGYQKRNLADMRAIGTAIEAYGVDHQSYPISDSNVSEIHTYLEPTYMKKVPLKDKWGNLFLYRSYDGQSYTLTSFGKDHKQDLAKNYKGIITRFVNDITFSNGSFTALPEGI
jgi:type II secretory pathway pseudopilin PulG